MCGIAGVISSERSEDLFRTARALQARLFHRGPDDEGLAAFFLSDSGVEARLDVDTGTPNAVLVHRRLSIIDLSSAGRQPMHSRDGRYWVVFNGEIYNYLELRTELETLGHEFFTNTDTEVLVNAWQEWGTESLTKLVGMFAFALMDCVGKRLYLVRDYFGIKPLYYATNNLSLVFASEVTALLEVPGIARTVKPESVYNYLVYGRTDYSDATLLSSVTSLLPAHYAEIDLEKPERITVRRYWDLDISEELDISFEEASVTVQNMFLENIRLHLRSDVPVGVALSGGLDSSAITSCIRKIEPNTTIHAFSYLAQDPRISERRWAEMAAKHVGAIWHPVEPHSGELSSDIERLVGIQGEPFGGTSMYAQYLVFRAAKEHGIKVMLDGQGGDELFAGYSIYKSARAASMLRRGEFQNASRLMATLVKNGEAARLGHFLLPPVLQRALRRLTRHHVWPPTLNKRWFIERGVQPRIGRRLSKYALREELYRTISTDNLPMLLRFEDRNSMAHSIESRVPFLTPKLAQFVFRLPEHFLIGDGGETKSVFRAAMAGILPETLRQRKDKVGFVTDEAVWIRGSSTWVEGLLDKARDYEFINGDQLIRVWRRLQSGNLGQAALLWRYLNFLAWAAMFGVKGA